MNLNDIDLNKEEHKQKIRQAFQSLQSQLKEEEKKRKEFEEKYYNSTQSLSQMDQRLAQLEFTIRRKNDDLITQETIVESLRKKLNQYEEILQDIDQQKKSLLGIFNGNNREQQLNQKIMDLEEELDIKNSEILRLHETLFEIRQQLAKQEGKYQKQFDQMKEAIRELQEQQEQTQKEKDDVQEQLNNQMEYTQKQLNQIDELKRQLTELEDIIRIQKENINQQSNQYSELQNTLVSKQEEIRKNYLESEQLRQNQQKLKDFFFEFMPLVENENQLQNQRQFVNLKQYTENLFGADKQKEEKIKYQQQCKELQKDFLNLQSPIEVFDKAKDKILKLNRLIEQLEKKNKQLQDRINLNETKRMYNKTDMMSDKTSVI